MAQSKAKKVFVAMSGGVDSSVAAALLKKAGYDVYGVFMQGWTNPNFTCQWQEDRRDASRVAAILDIPFRVLDFSHEYYTRVVTYVTQEYQAGRTPNPDVMCNKEIKFGLFFDWAMSEGADFVATGHYVQRARSTDGSDTLHIAKDTNKDQTYFLWTLEPRHIARTLFPVGEYTKPEVREIAHAHGLPTASKKDSQGICFVGKGSITDFLKQEISTTPGAVLTASGKKVGEHDGVELFTIGQRHGIGVPGGSVPYYVAEKHAKSATLIVAEGENDAILYKKELSFKNPNWLASVQFPLQCKARIRYRQPLVKCVIHADLEAQLPSTGKVIFDEPQRAVAPGQSVVFYDGDRILGGGVID